METTGAVVCVLDATTQNLRTSKAIRVVQEMRDSLKANAIGVFSKTDLTRDANWKDKVGANFNSPFYKVENWIRGFDDKSGNLAFLRNFRSGFVALKNRQTDSVREQSVTLTAHNQIEMDFFCNSQMSSTGEKAFLRPKIDSGDDDLSFLPPSSLSSPNPFLTPALSDSHTVMTLSDYGMRVLGLNALLQKIDRVIRRHIGKSWVPQEVAEHQSRKRVVTEHLQCMGCPPDQLAVEDLQLQFCESFFGRLSEYEDEENSLLGFLADLAADCLLCGSLEDGLFSLTTSRSERAAIAAEFFQTRQSQQSNDFQEELDCAELKLFGAESAYMRMRVRRLLERNFAATMDAPDELAALGLKTAIEHEIRETLLDSDNPPVRLVRFSESLSWPLLDSCMRILNYDMSAFKAQARAVFQHCTLESYRDPYDPDEIRDNLFGTLYCDIKRALKEVVFEYLLIPCFVGKVPPFARNAFANVLEVPLEDCAEERSALEQRLMTIDEVIAELESIDDAPPGAEDDAAEAELESAAAAKSAPVRSSQALAKSNPSLCATVASERREKLQTIPLPVFRFSAGEPVKLRSEPIKSDFWSEAECPDAPKPPRVRTPLSSNGSNVTATNR
jgi:hypothetical protein